MKLKDILLYTIIAIVVLIPAVALSLEWNNTCASMILGIFSFYITGTIFDILNEAKIKKVKVRK